MERRWNGVIEIEMKTGLKRPPVFSFQQRTALLALSASMSDLSFETDVSDPKVMELGKNEAPPAPVATSEESPSSVASFPSSSLHPTGGFFKMQPLPPPPPPPPSAAVAAADAPSVMLVDELDDYFDQNAKTPRASGKKKLSSHSSRIICGNGDVPTEGNAHLEHANSERDHAMLSTPSSTRGGKRRFLSSILSVVKPCRRKGTQNRNNTAPPGGTVRSSCTSSRGRRLRKNVRDLDSQRTKVTGVSGDTSHSSRHSKTPNLEDTNPQLDQDRVSTSSASVPAEQLSCHSAERTRPECASKCKAGERTSVPVLPKGQRSIKKPQEPQDEEEHIRPQNRARVFRGQGEHIRKLVRDMAFDPYNGDVHDYENHSVLSARRPRTRCSTRADPLDQASFHTPSDRDWCRNSDWITRQGRGKGGGPLAVSSKNDCDSSYAGMEEDEQLFYDSDPCIVRHLRPPSNIVALTLSQTCSTLSSGTKDQQQHEEDGVHLLSLSNSFDDDSTFDSVVQLEDKDLIEDRLEDAKNRKMDLIWHPIISRSKNQKQDGQSVPLRTTAWIEMYSTPGNDIDRPKLVWKRACHRSPKSSRRRRRRKTSLLHQENRLYSLELLQVCRILPSRSVAESLIHPMATGRNTFVIELLDGTTYLFEASSERDCEMDIRSLKIIVARYAAFHHPPVVELATNPIHHMHVIHVDDDDDDDDDTLDGKQTEEEEEEEGTSDHTATAAAEEVGVEEEGIELFFPIA